MVMVENPSHHPDPEMTSFSCRLVVSKRKLPEGERPNLMQMLKEYGTKVGNIGELLTTSASDICSRQEMTSWNG
jgi:hypothetical protein